MATPAPTPAVGYGASGSQSISPHSILRVARILALVLGVLALAISIADLILAVLAGIAGFFFAVPGYIGGTIYFLLSLFVCALIWVRIPRFESMIDRAPPAQARESLLLWGILGILFGFVVLGILLLWVFFKVDAAGRGAAFPAAPSPTSPTAPVAVPPGAVNAAGPSLAFAGAGEAQVRCPRCGNLGSFVAQYGRYYCYNCQRYL
jgi:hypothetical protein